MRKKYGETDIQAAERYIRERRAAAALFPALCGVFRRFDGKMYNIKLSRALAAEIGRIYTEVRYSTINIWCYSESGEYITLASIDYPADKRVHAADFIKAAENKKNELLREADHMAHVLPTIEVRRRQIEIIKRQLDGVLCDLSYEEKDLFNLNARISNY